MGSNKGHVGEKETTYREGWGKFWGHRGKLLCFILGLLLGLGSGITIALLIVFVF